MAGRARHSVRAFVVWRTQTRHGLRWQGAAATPLSPPPRLPASQPTIARRHSFAFPNFRFSLFATPCHPPFLYSARAGAFQDAPRHPSVPANAPASWIAVALHRSSHVRPSPTNLKTYPFQSRLAQSPPISAISHSAIRVHPWLNANRPPLPHFPISAFCFLLSKFLLLPFAFCPPTCLSNFVKKNFKNILTSPA